MKVMESVLYEIVHFITCLVWLVLFLKVLNWIFERV